MAGFIIDISICYKDIKIIRQYAWLLVLDFKLYFRLKIYGIKETEYAIAEASPGSPNVLYITILEPVPY